MILEAKLSGLICGFKLYPAGATTNSESGVTNIENMANVFETMEEVQTKLYHSCLMFVVCLLNIELLLKYSIYRLGCPCYCMAK